MTYESLKHTGAASGKKHTDMASSRAKQHSQLILVSARHTYFSVRVVLLPIPTHTVSIHKS